MKAIYPGDERLGVDRGDVVIVWLQHSLHQFEFVLADCFQHETTVIRIIEETARLTRAEKLSHRLEIGIKHVSKNLFRP